MLPWHLQSFLKARCFLLPPCECGWVGSKVGGAILAGALCESMRGVCGPERGVGFSASDSQVGLPLPRHASSGRDQLPLPTLVIPARASGYRDLALPGLGDYPHSLCLWRGRVSLPLLSPHKGQDRWACCVRVSVAREALLPFLLPSPEGHAESASLLGATAVAPGQMKGPGVTQPWEEKAEGVTRQRVGELLFKR